MCGRFAPMGIVSSIGVVGEVGGERRVPFHAAMRYTVQLTPSNVLLFGTNRRQGSGNLPGRCDVARCSRRVDIVQSTLPCLALAAPEIFHPCRRANHTGQATQAKLSAGNTARPINITTTTDVDFSNPNSSTATLHPPTPPRHLPAALPLPAWLRSLLHPRVSLSHPPRAKRMSFSLSVSAPHPSTLSSHAGALANDLHRLYVRHLPDKLQKSDLQRNLYMLFATYGIILDIVALKTPKMRGQAHIVFRDVDSSTQAMRALDGFEFFGKKMVPRHPPTPCAAARMQRQSLIPRCADNRIRQRQVEHHQ